METKLRFESSRTSGRAAKRNIIHLIGSGVMGGREKQLFMILRAQSSVPEYNVGVLFQDPAGPNYELISSLKNVSVKYLPDAGELSLQSMKSCLQTIRQADVVFLHSPRIVFMLPLLFTRQPLIYRLSGIFTMPLGFFKKASSNGQTDASALHRGAPQINVASIPTNGHTKIASTSHNGSARRITAIKNKFSVRAQRVSRWFLFHRILTKRSTVVLVISQFLKQRAMELYSVPDRKLRLIRIGIDPAYEQQRLEVARPILEADEKFTISVVARLDIRKRIDRLFEAIVPLVQQGIPLRVLIAGDGDQKKKLESLSRSLGIDHVVEFLGEINNPYDVLTASDLFVLPSDNEAFSNSVLEAMFSEIPVVVFAGGCGASEAINDRVDGFIVSDVSDLTNVIIEIMTNPEFGRRVGKQAKAALVGKRLTFESHTESLNDIMNEALQLTR